jgi:hypothetical protein
MHKKIIRKYSERLLGVHSLILSLEIRAKVQRNGEKTLTAKLNFKQGKEP